jgi:hypothetical protein
MGTVYTPLMFILSNKYQKQANFLRELYRKSLHSCLTIFQTSQCSRRLIQFMVANAGPS